MGHRKLLLICSLLTTAACLQVDPEGPATPLADAGLTPDQFAAAYGVALCNSQASFFVLPQATTLACVDLALDGGGPLGGLGAAVDAGRMSYDVTDAIECLDAYADGGGAGQAPPPCLAAAAGAVPLGGSCRWLDCANGYCQLTGPYDPETCRGYTCLPYAEEGQICDGDNAPCNPGEPLICGSSSTCQPLGVFDAGGPCDDATNFCQGSPVCTDGVCTPSSGLANAPCDNQWDTCQPDFYCQTTALPSWVGLGICEPVAGLGQTCGATSLAAADNATYSPAQCGSLLETCAGQATDPDGGVISAGACGLLTDVGGACQTPPPGFLPAPFVGPSGSFISGCKLGLNCVDGLCQLPTNSSDCETTGFCLSGFYCAGDAGCEPQLSPGAACTLETQGACSSGFCGTSNRCLAPCPSL